MCICICIYNQYYRGIGNPHAESWRLTSWRWHIWTLRWRRWQGVTVPWRGNGFWCPTGKLKTWPMTKPNRLLLIGANMTQWFLIEKWRTWYKTYKKRTEDPQKISALLLFHSCWTRERCSSSQASCTRCQWSLTVDPQGAPLNPFKIR